MSDEQKQKSQLNKGRTSFWKDKHLPEETKQKMREAWIRRKNNKENNKDVYEKLE